MKSTSVQFSILLLIILSACTSSSNDSNSFTPPPPPQVDSVALQPDNEFHSLNPEALKTFDERLLIPYGSLEYNAKFLHLPQESFMEATKLAKEYPPDEFYIEILRRLGKIKNDTTRPKELEFMTVQEFITKKKNSAGLHTTSDKQLLSGYELSSFLRFGKRIVNGGTDDRKEVKYDPEDLGATDGISPEMRNAKCVAVAIPRYMLDSTSNNTYTLNKNHETYNERFNVCLTDSFSWEPAPASFTAFYVKENVLVATGHSVNEKDYKSYYYVFDYILEKDGSPKTVFKASSVFKGIDILHRYDTSLGIDYSIIKLNKPVDTLRKPTINKKGFTLPSSFYVIGTPAGIPLKLATNAYLILNTNKQYFTVGSDTYECNSGSPVFNSDTHEIEGYLVKGGKDFRFIIQECQNTNICYYPTCPGSEGERVIRISEIMNLIN